MERVIRRFMRDGEAGFLGMAVFFRGRVSPLKKHAARESLPPMQSLPPALLVFLGGGLGAVCRWALSSGVHALAGARFPLGILLCNVLGSLAIGFLAGTLSAREQPHLPPFLITGFLGSFTTFSTFALDTRNLFDHGHPALAAANVLLSVALSLAGVWLGARLAG